MLLLIDARRLTEVVEKWVYDRSWEWFDSTALTVAARMDEPAMVNALLLAGADPTLVGCRTSDVNENASSRMYKRDYRELPEGTGKGKLTWSQEYPKSFPGLT